MALSLHMLGLCAGLLASPLIACAQQAAPATSADVKAIDATLQQVGNSLTRMDFDTFATLFTDDADFVNVVGMHWKGKAQVVEAHRVIFTTRYHGFPQHIVDEQVEIIAPDVALAVTTVKMDDYTAQDGRRMVNNVSRLTWVLIRHDGEWLVRSGHNTTVDHEAAKHDPARSHVSAPPVESPRSAVGPSK